jgi:hypothetical protein
MATPVAESRANANWIQSGQGAWPLPTHLRGRITGLAVYELKYDTLRGRVNNLQTVVESIGNDDGARRSDHGDELGNLPFAPTQGYAVAEYHVGANGLPYPAHLRVLYDSYRRIIYVTHCHYDPWTDATGTNRNPFYLVLDAPLPTKLKL